MSAPANDVGTEDATVENSSFTWINVEDQEATRRVKALAIRDYRRKQKAEAAQYQKRKENASRRTVLSVASAAPTKPPQQASKGKSRPVRIVAKIVDPVPVLEKQIGTNVDPFNLFPAQLNSHRDRSLVHHCKK